MIGRELEDSRHGLVLFAEQGGGGMDSGNAGIVIGMAALVRVGEYRCGPQRFKKRCKPDGVSSDSEAGLLIRAPQADLPHGREAHLCQRLCGFVPPQASVIEPVPAARILNIGAAPRGPISHMDDGFQPLYFGKQRSQSDDFVVRVRCHNHRWPPNHGARKPAFATNMTSLHRDVHGAAIVTGGMRFYISRRFSSDFDMVTSSANSRSLPTGIPMAMRVTRGRAASAGARYTAVASPSTVGLVATMISSICRFDAVDQTLDLRAARARCRAAARWTHAERDRGRERRVVSIGRILCGSSTTQINE